MTPNQIIEAYEPDIDHIVLPQNVHYKLVEGKVSHAIYGVEHNGKVIRISTSSRDARSKAGEVILFGEYGGILMLEVISEFEARTGLFPTNRNPKTMSREPEHYKNFMGWVNDRAITLKSDHHMVVSFTFPDEDIALEFRVRWL